jgi:hypothetical protein
MATLVMSEATPRASNRSLEPRRGERLKARASVAALTAATVATECEADAELEGEAEAGARLSGQKRSGAALPAEPAKRPCAAAPSVGRRKLGDNSVGKCPPQDMKRMSICEPYVVTRVARWGEKLALFMRPKTSDERPGFFKPPLEFRELIYHAGDVITLDTVGYSLTRNKVAQEISVDSSAALCRDGCVLALGVTGGCCSVNANKLVDAQPGSSSSAAGGSLSALPDQHSRNKVSLKHGTKSVKPAPKKALRYAQLKTQRSEQPQQLTKSHQPQQKQQVQPQQPMQLLQPQQPKQPRHSQQTQQTQELTQLEQLKQPSPPPPQQKLQHQHQHQHQQQELRPLPQLHTHQHTHQYTHQHEHQLKQSELEAVAAAMFSLAKLTQDRATTPPPVTVPQAQSRSGSVTPQQAARHLSMHSLPTLSPHEQQYVPRRTFSAPLFSSPLFMKGADEDVQSSAELLRHLRSSNNHQEQQRLQLQQQQQLLRVREHQHQHQLQQQVQLQRQQLHVHEHQLQQQQQQQQEQQHQHQHQQDELLVGQFLLAQELHAVQLLLQQTEVMAVCKSQCPEHDSSAYPSQGERQRHNETLIARDLWHPNNDGATEPGCASAPGSPAVVPPTLLRFNSSLDVLKHLSLHF